MKEIVLTQGRVALVDDCDFEYLNQFKWRFGSSGYAVRDDYSTGKRVYVLMHRLVMNAPADCMVDHVSGDTLDNRRSNLRLCTNAENRRNSRRYANNTSGFKGVYFYRGKWHTRIYVNSTVKRLGVFDNKFEAALAYDRAAREHHGDFANTNFNQNQGTLTFNAASFDSLISTERVLL